MFHICCVNLPVKPGNHYLSSITAMATPHHTSLACFICCVNLPVKPGNHNLSSITAMVTPHHTSLACFISCVKLPVKPGNHNLSSITAMATPHHTSLACFICCVKLPVKPEPREGVGEVFQLILGDGIAQGNTSGKNNLCLSCSAKVWEATWAYR